MTDLNLLLQKAIADHQQGRLNEALTQYEDLVRLVPQSADLYYLMGAIKFQLADRPRAKALLQQAVTFQPSHADSFNILGQISQDEGRTNEALDFFKRALEFSPQNSTAYNNLGMTYRLLGNAEMALDSYNKALQINPQYIEALNNRGNILMEAGDFRGAYADFENCIKLAPQYDKAKINLAMLCVLQGDLVNAKILVGVLVNEKKVSGPLLKILGLIHQKEGKNLDAISFFRQAIDINPLDHESWYNLATLYWMEGDIFKTQEAFNECLKIIPDYEPALWSEKLFLPVVYEAEEQIKRWRDRFEDGLNFLKQRVESLCNVQKAQLLSGASTINNFYLPYQGQNDLELQKKYQSILSKILPEPPRAQPVTKNDRIKIGFVSAYFKNHTISKLFGGWIEGLPSERYQKHLYYFGVIEDQTTQSLMSACDKHVRLPENYSIVAEFIKRDALDILVFTDVGMNPTSVMLAGSRLATIQCVTWGHPQTTGSRQIDFFLSAESMEPKSAQEYYSEKLVLLPGSSVSFKKPDFVPSKTKKDFGLPENKTVYLSSQSLFKYLPQHDFIYPQIAKENKNSLFVFIENPSEHVNTIFKNRLQRAFGLRSMDYAHFVKMEKRLNDTDFLHLNSVCDVALDSLEWSGGNTTFEALSVGLPIVACKGPMMRGSHAYGILASAGLTDTLALNVNDYIGLAIKLGQDKKWRLQLKDKILKAHNQIFSLRENVEAVDKFFSSLV